MIIGRGTTHDGRDVLVIGLSRRNVELLQQDKPIYRDMPPEIVVRAGSKISIIFGETEQEIADRLQPELAKISGRGDPT